MPSSLHILDDANLVKMLRNLGIVQAFPFMSAASKKVQTAAGKKACCGGCRGRKNRRNTDDAEFEGIRQQIASMSAPQKLKLKGMLNTDQIRMYYRNTKKQRIKLTF